jgi:sec-independent protein translocase protein TatB
MNLFGVGPGEAFLVVIIALLVVGPDRFPEVARQAARYYKLARRYTDEVMKDVRAAVDELESEVGGPGEDLRSIREIGSSFAADLRSTREELNTAGEETRATLEATGADAAAAMPADDEVPAALTSPTTEATTEDQPAADAQPAEAQPADAQPADTEPAPATHEPVSMRPSKRTQPKAPADPFAALEAKRARDRERTADDQPTANGHQ